MKPVNPHVYQVVRDRRRWQEPPAPVEAELEKGLCSKGWYTRGYLPHFDKPGTLQMLTFRLADAMPARRRHEWETLLAIEDERERRTKIEAYLDRGHGECVMRDARTARVVEETLLFFDGLRYRLVAWVVMPNHIHALVELWQTPLSQLLKSWKGVSARAVNRLLGRTGPLWQPDFWDRYIRDERHFRRANHYIEANPVKACLVKEPADWQWSSANPKWQWSESNRYQGGALLNKPREWLVEQLKAERKTRREADKIVRAPFLRRSGTRISGRSAGNPARTQPPCVRKASHRLERPDTGTDD